MKSAYCRLCAELKPRNKLKKLESDDDKKDIVNKLWRLNTNSVDFNEGFLPKTICYVCINTLNRAFAFVLNIEQAQVVLNDIILEKNIKQEDVDTKSDSECDNYVYEAQEDGRRSEVAVKIETNCNEHDYKLEDSKTELNCEIKKKKCKRQLSLDAIPLSQLKLSWRDYTWTCSYCDTLFGSFEELKTHSMQFHVRCNAFKCTDCKIRKSKLDSFLVHVKRHRKYLKLSCYICFTKFATPHKTKIHNKTHVDTDYICTGCNMSFQSSDELKNHMQKFNTDKRKKQYPISQNLNNSLTCIFCEKTFKNKGNLNTHMLIHTDRKRDHTCDKCGKCFFNKHSLASHMLQHDDARPYKCEICKSDFKTLVQLRNHVKIHDNHKPYACEDCGKCFRFKKQLKNHYIVHTDILPYTCSYCSKSFRFKSLLNIHVRQHTGVKPYSCEQCQRDFTNWANYNKHMKRRHGTDMARKKRTPDGVYPVNPVTGELIVYPETDKIVEWKKKVLTHRGPGRPKIDRNAKDIKDNSVSKEESKCDPINSQI